MVLVCLLGLGSEPGSSGQNSAQSWVCHLPQFPSLAAPRFLSREGSLCSCLCIINH